MKKLIVVLTAAIAGLGATAADLNDVPDLKPLAMRVYGLRRAWPLDATTVRVSIGASCTGARSVVGAWRIVSRDDPDYAYEKFVKPTAVKAPPERVEFPFPEGFWAPNAANVPLIRAEVTLTLPVPLKAGKRYAVLGQGEGQGLVTVGCCAASFVFGGPEQDASSDIEALAAQMSGLRRASSVGDGKILCEFGHGYSIPGGLKLANWSVTVNGEKVVVRGMGRRSKLECYQPIGWPYRTLMRNDIFLDLGRELKNGDWVVVSAAPAVSAGAREASFAFDSARSLTRSIQANQVGYLPYGPKFAYLGCWFGSFPEKDAVSAEIKADAPVSFTLADYYAEAGKGTQEERELAALAAAEAEVPAEKKEGELAPYALGFKTPPAFRLLDAANGRETFRGTAKFVHNGLEMDGKANHSAQNVYVLDFSDFKEPGRYVLSVDGVGRSLPFDIAADVYQRAFRVQAQGVYCQRCGCPLDPKLSGGWQRIACHTNGIVTTTERRCDTGEWGRFTENMEMDPNPAYPKVKAAREKVQGDPSAIALDLKPVGASKLVTDPKYGKAWKTGSSEGGVRNGIVAPFAFDPEKGCTLSFFALRDDSLAGGKWGGTLVGFRGEKAGLGVGVVWGCPAFGSIRYGRYGDKAWHHLTIRVLPGIDARGNVTAQFRFDGSAQGGKDQKMIAAKVDSVVFGDVTDDGAEGCYFKDIRMFGRALSDGELADLVSTVPEKIPHRLPVVGGHHDAGDYNPRSHIDVAQALMNAYELKPGNFADAQLNVPERGNGIPDILDEAMWAVRLWEGLQDADGGVRNGTESQGDPGFTQTVELDDKGDYAWAKDAKGSYLAAGVFAQASRILRPLGRAADADRLLDRARRAYAWAAKNPTEGIKALQTYGEYNFALRAYAAAELFHTTGEKGYHADFLAFSPWAREPNSEIVSYGYFNATLAAYAYALIPREKADPKVWDAVMGAIRKEAEMYVRGSEKMAYKFLRHPYAPITWGTGAYQTYSIAPAFVWILTGDTSYRDWIIRTCDNTLGANPLGLSWITGLGSRMVRCPLHNSRYRDTGFPVDGLQVQGPNARGAGYNWTDTAYPWHKNDFATLHAFSDTHFAIAMDEPTVNNMANTMMIFGLLAK